MITDAQRKHYETAISYMASRRDKQDNSADKNLAAKPGRPDVAGRAYRPGDTGQPTHR